MAKVSRKGPTKGVFNKIIGSSPAHQNLVGPTNFGYFNNSQFAVLARQFAVLSRQFGIFSRKFVILTNKNAVSGNKNAILARQNMALNRQNAIFSRQNAVFSRQNGSLETCVTSLTLKVSLSTNSQNEFLGVSHFTLDP